ncbi:MAG: hypothetical protein ACR2QT_04490 [Woeseiaceae bacterium]
MASKLVVSFEGDHIHVVSDGDKSYEFVVDMWTQVATLCREHQCFNVLGLATTTTPLEAVDGYDHGRLFRELEMPSNIRIAWVESNPEAIDIASFVELVLVNRGYNAKVFATEYEARTWLLGDE